MLTRALVVHGGYDKFRSLAQSLQEIVDKSANLLSIDGCEGVLISLHCDEGEALTVSRSTTNEKGTSSYSVKIPTLKPLVLICSYIRMCSSRKYAW